MRRTNVNARDLKRVSVSINSTDGTFIGSGIGICVKGKYYVLTAAHCLFDIKGKVLETSQISLKGGYGQWENSIVINEIKLNKKTDSAALEVIFTKDIPEDFKSALTQICILDENIDYDFRLCGYIGGYYKNEGVKYCSERDLDIRIQYTGAEIANLCTVDKYFKGLSGSGIYCSYDNKLFVYAYLCELGENCGENNELICHKASCFLELLPDLPILHLDEKTIESPATVKDITPFFVSVKDSLLRYEEFTKYPFVNASKLDEIIKALRDEEEEMPIMLTALSGMGKTRLLYEAFKNQYDLNNCYFVKYYDSDEGIYKEADSILRNKIEELGVLIIDDCPQDLFEEICKCRNQYDSQFRIIATNHDYFDINDDPKWKVLRLQAKDIKKEIDAFIDEQLQPNDSNKSDVEEIKRIAEGFPQMAIDLINAYRDGKNPEVQLVDGLMAKILKFDVGSEKEQEIVMEALSLCQPTPYTGNHHEAFKYLISSNVFTRLYGKTYDERCDICNRLVKKYKGTLIEVQGDWLMVRPFPLAVYLTKKWFDYCDTERFGKLLEDIKTCPENIQMLLSDGFCRHIEQMHGNKSAFELVAKLVEKDENAPFFHEEVLCSGLGSKFFLSLASVNPAAVASCINHLVYSKDIEWLVEHLDGKARMNIVWALEKMCFATESFRDAILALARLAVAENETFYSNNSVGQLQQLFHIYLAGTEVNLSERVWALGKFVELGEKYREITLKCIGSAFDNGSMTRTMGAEKFGTVSRKDYMPKTYREIFDYWYEVRDLLIEIVESDKPHLTTVMKIVEAHTPTWLYDKNFKVYFPLLECISKKVDYHWESMYQILCNEREEVVSSFTDEELTNFKSWLSRLRPSHFITDLMDVNRKLWKKHKLNNEEFWNYALKLFAPQASMFIEKEIYKDSSEVTLILENKEFGSRAFLENLGKKMNDSQLHDFLQCITNIVINKDEDFYSSFLQGICIEFYKRQACQDFLDSLYAKGCSLLYTKLLAGCENDSLEQFEKITKNITDGSLPISSLEVYLRFVQSLSSDAFDKLINSFASFSTNVNVLLDFVIRKKYWYEDVLKNSLFPLLKSLTLKYVIDEQVNHNDYMQFVISLLEWKHDDDYARQVNLKFMALYNQVRSYNFHDGLYTCLLKLYPNAIWDELMSALIDDDKFIFYFHVCDELGSGTGFGKGALFNLPDSEQRMRKFCRDFPDKAPRRVASMAPCFDFEEKDGNKILTGFSSYLLWLMEKFGTDEEVLSNIHANLGSFFWSGSTIPYYERNIFCFQKVLENEKMPDCVKAWASKSINEYEKALKLEKDQEDYMWLKYNYKP